MSLLLLCHRSVSCIRVGAFLGSLFVPLIHLSVLAPASCCLDHCSFIISHGLSSGRPPTLFLSLCCVGCPGSLVSVETSELVCQHPQNDSPGFWLELNIRLSWKKLTSCQFWVSLPMDMEYFSIYLDLLFFFYQSFMIFLIYFIHFLSLMPKHFPFFGAYVSHIVFLSSGFNCCCTEKWSPFVY